MKKPATRKDRFQIPHFKETNWTSSSKNIGEYLFRRITLDQSNKKLQDLRPRHMMSQLIISSKEINQYVNDYLHMMEKRNRNKSSKSVVDTVKLKSEKQDYNRINAAPKI